MKWYFNLNRKIQIAIPLICIAISIIFFIVGGTTFLLIGTVLLIIGIPFVFLFDKAEKQRKAKQSSAHPQTKDPVINEHDSTESIIKLARKRASEIIQKGDTAVQARICELETLIMPEAEREKLNNPSDIPTLQRQVVLLYEQEALLQYMASIAQHAASSPAAHSTATSPFNTSYFNTVTVVDFETATNNMTSLCAVGLCFINDGKIVGSEHYYVQPPENRYDADMIAIHGITPDVTKDAEPFPAVWEKIKHHFQNTYVASHNSKRFDMPALKATLDRYHISHPDFYFLDTMYICDEYKDESCRRSLSTLCKSFGIPLENHHNALCDAEAAANLILYSFEHSRFRVFRTWLRYAVKLYAFDEVVARLTFQQAKHEHLDVKEIAATTAVNAEKDNDFNGKTFLFTGSLQHFSREEAMRKVVERGGIIKNGISNKVDVLVNANPDGVTTSKVERALAMQAAGHRIKIINEEQFLEMLESNDAIEL